MTPEKKNRLKSIIFIIVGLIAIAGIIIVIVHYLQVAKGGSSSTGCLIEPFLNLLL